MTEQPAPPLPELARDTTAENPWPLRLLSAKVEQYINRMSEVWVEGQIVQLNDHNSSSLAYITLRDTEEDVSMSLTIPKRNLRAQGPNIREGDHVVTCAKPTFWRRRGTLQLAATQISALGEGDLLAKIEKLKRELAAEGLFDADRKVPLPFLPRKIGLIAGPKAKAQDDVIVNARDRWPSMEFEIRNVAVQGPNCVDQVSAALRDLDAHPEVDVIIVTRGGGSVEDLLPFSSEIMVRTAAQIRTPIISAIGHETDNPLLDFVADFRASTPTDAAKRAVPDALAELDYTMSLTGRLRSAISGGISRRREQLTALASRPVLTQPAAMLQPHRATLEQLTTAASRAFSQHLAEARRSHTALATALRTLSPQSTLDRGYSVLRDSAGIVVRDAATIEPGATLHARLASGELQLEATGANIKITAGTQASTKPKSRTKTSPAESSES